MQDDWIPIFTTEQSYQAEFIKETLGINNIEAEILKLADCE